MKKLAVDFKAAETGDGISALPNPTGGGREGELHFINAPASLIRDRDGEEATTLASIPAGANE
ncbi:hypothetical protein PAMP_006646 [Pampus punctatissimus]